MTIERQPHYVLPDGRLVRLVRWLRKPNHDFVIRVTSTGRDRLEFLDSWFQENAVNVGQVSPAIGR